MARDVAQQGVNDNVGFTGTQHRASSRSVTHSSQHSMLGPTKKQNTKAGQAPKGRQGTYLECGQKSEGPAGLVARAVRSAIMCAVAYASHNIC